MIKNFKFYVAIFSVFTSLLIGQIPAGYYDGTSGLTGATLKTKLSAIISAGAKDNGYDALYTGYPTTDSDHSYENDGSVLDMYSEDPTGSDPYNYQHGVKKCGNYSTEGDCYNREHVIPQSFFDLDNNKKGDPPMVSDIHFIRPTDGKVNGMRSNYPFGTVSKASFTSKNGSKLGPCSATGYTGTVFEPIDEFKGDIARMVFYFVTRYESKLSGFSTGNMLGDSTYPGLQTWELNVLLTWAAQDPVSASEIERNDASYNFQNNRNPYIDHPEWVQLVWGSQTSDTESPSTPTNLTVASTSTTSANLSWTASTDNIAVAYYKIYVDSVFKTNSSSTTATVSGLTQGTTYHFHIVAVDAAGNTSPQSNTASGTTLTDTIAPSAPSNLAASSVGTNSIDIQWIASTDNIKVASYDIYVDSVLMGSTLSTSTNIANLNPSTTYTIYVVAKDAVGNVSPQSNSVSATTLAVGTTCGNENFETIPASSSAYSAYNWTSKGISWTTEESRTDQTINNTRAITIKNGSLTALSVPNGIGDLTITTQQKYNGTAGNLNILVNGNVVGTVPYSASASASGGTIITTTVSGINISGTVEISLVNTSTTRVAIDDMTWSCYAPLSTKETSTKPSLKIYPNPVRNGELNVVDTNDLSKIVNVQIIDFTGKVVQSISQPFKNSNKIKIKNLPKGVYILKSENINSKFIVE